MRAEAGGTGSEAAGARSPGGTRDGLCSWSSARQGSLWRRHEASSAGVGAVIRAKLAGLATVSLLAWSVVAAAACAAPRQVSAQTRRVALAVSLSDEHGASARALLVAVPVKSIAGADARWGYGPVLGIGSVANPGRRQDVEFAELGFRIARVFRLGGGLRPLVSRGESIGISGSVGVGGTSPFDTASVPPFPGAGSGREAAWYPTARVELLWNARIGGPGTPAVATLSFGRVFRWGAEPMSLGLDDRWYTALGIEVATR